MIAIESLPKGRPLVLLTDRPHRQQALERRLAGQGVSGVTVTSGAGLAQFVLERLLEGNTETVSRARRRRILAETLEGDPNAFKDLFKTAPRQAVSLLLPLVEEAGMEEFDEASVKPAPAVETVVRARFKGVRELAGAYRKRLEKEGADEVTLLRRAVAAAGKKKLPWTVLPVDRHVPRLVKRLLDSFECSETPLLPDSPIPADRIRVYRPRDAEEEAELTARILIQAKITSWRDVVVVADDKAAPLVAAELAAHGIPVAARWGRALGTTGGWRLVSSWLSILSGPFGPGEVASAILGMGIHKEQGVTSEAVGQSLEKWISTPERLRALLDKDTKTGKGLEGTQIGKLIKEAPYGSKVPDALEWIRKNVIEPIDKRLFASPDPAGAALRREMRDSIELLDAMKDAGTVPEILEEALRAASPLEHDLRSAGVEIQSEPTDPGRQVSLVVATGFVRGRYPATPPIRPIIGDPERAAAGLPLAEDELLERRTDLLGLLGACTGEIVFTSPHRREGEWVEPSLLLDEILSQAPQEWGRERVTDLGAPGVKTAPPMLRTKRGLLRAVTSELNLPNLPAETLRAAKALAADPAAREILEAPRRPLRDYRLGRPVAFEGLSLSPSILDKSLGCRYFFFASTLLDIGDLEPAGRWEFGPLEMGTLAHRVMEKLALEAPEGKATVKKALETLKDAAGELYSWALDGRFGLALAALEHAISELIPRYLEILEAVKGVPFGAEIPLRDSEGKRPLFPLPSRVGIPKGIPMGGRIDQALKLALGTSLILDFKWGGVERKVPAQVKADLDAQAPLYAWFLREDGRFPKPAGALYMSIARDEAVFRPAKDPGGLPAMLQGKALVVNEPVLEASGTQLANKLADLLEALATPDAECAPVDGPGWDDLVKAQSDPCQYCSFGLLCRSRKRGN